MLVENKGKRTFQHVELDEKKQIKTISLLPGAHLEVPDNVAKLWLETGEVIEYADPVEVKAKQSDLEAENAKLREELEKLKAKQSDNKPEKSLEDLKKEADDLGLTYAKNISASTLAKKIEEFKGKKSEDKE